MILCSLCSMNDYESLSLVVGKGLFRCLVELIPRTQSHTYARMYSQANTKTNKPTNKHAFLSCVSPLLPSLSFTPVCLPFHYGTGQPDCGTSKSRFPTSLGVSEWAQRSARAKRAVRSKRTSERCERTSERMSEWPGTNILISRSSESLCAEREECKIFQ